jgi:hypothetical protein
MAQVPSILRPEGIAVFECAESQVADLLEQASTVEWVERAAPVHDLAGRPRGVVVHKKK